MKRIIPGLLIGIVFLSACGGPPPATNTPVTSITADVPANTPTVTPAPTEVVIPIPKEVLSNYFTEATDETGVTPTSISDLDLSVMGTDQTMVVGEIEAAAGQDAKAIESWDVSWLWANGYLDDENGNSPSDYDKALDVFNERYDFVGYISDSGSWSLTPREKDTGKIGRAVDVNGDPLNSSLMPLNVTSLEQFDLEFEMPEGGVDQFVTSNADGSVFSLVVTDENGNAIAWYNTETGQIVEGRVVNVANMQEFDESWVWEPGTVIRVEDYYGAGPATIKVKGVKLPKEGEELGYGAFRVTDNGDASLNKRTLDLVSYSGMVVEGVSWMSVDIDDNSFVADGQQGVLKLRTTVDGVNTSFDLWYNTDYTEGYKPSDTFRERQIGDTVFIGLDIITSGPAIDFANLDELYVFNKDIEDDRNEARFWVLGTQGDVAMSRSQIKEIIKAGGRLSKIDGVLVINITEQTH